MDVFSRKAEAGFQHMCEAVFVRLCQIVGTSIQVADRRELKDMLEMMQRQVHVDNNVTRMASGSTGEGFRLEGSDYDVMLWQKDHRVIWDIPQSEYYDTATKTLILSDNFESPPGFTLLELLTPTTSRYGQSACVRMNDRLYISSSLFRGHMDLFNTISDSTEYHGPCISGEVGGLEYDVAYSFACDFWPPSASSWIDRCHSWPDNEVVNDTVRNGCHLVPIGNPLGLHGHEQEEWRISFSLAEHKLVHTMSHYQFLMYGLLKIFLKEVIDKQSDETNKLLCSYHMKTAVFWVIQQNNIPFWCPQDILTGFWVCFKVLLKWVYEGVCPNFFIPQNNLFLSKVHGSAQRSLFLQLQGLYEKGLTCLLQSSSIRSYITAVLYNPRLSICTDEDRLMSENEYAVQLFTEIANNDLLFTTNLYHSIRFLHLLEQLIGSPLTQKQVLMLQRLTATVFQETAFRLQNMYFDTVLKKQTYIADKISCHLLKLAAKFGWFSDMVYIAVYYYKTFRFWKASSVIEIIKVKLEQPYLMYNAQLGDRRYTAAVGRLSWSKKMRQVVDIEIKLNSSVCYINELKPEHQSAVQNSYSALCIPLFVMLHFVEFLCYRHIDTTLAQAALDELQLLVHHDQGLYVRDVFRDISWQILGICQQMIGNHRAALYSYQQSLQQYPYHNIQTATHMRIQDLHIT